MKSIKLKQDPYIAQDCESSEPYYIASLKDDDGIEYRVVWAITMLEESRSTCDDNDMCDWDDYTVTDENGEEADVIIVW